MNYNLKTFDTIKWLRNRYKSKVKDKYILYESELQQQNMMKSVFNSIDRDKSKFLDRAELYDMFIKYGINISKTKLKAFFKSIDEDDDDKLNWNDFKQALKNQEALSMFVQLMKRLREDYENSDQNLTFIPLSFPQMIQYLNYCVLREELIDKIQSDNISNYQKHKQCVNLLTLEDACYRNIKCDVNYEEEDDQAQQYQKMDHAQLIQLKRYQEREQKIKQLVNSEQTQAKLQEMNRKKYYTCLSQDLSQSESVRFNSDGQQMRADLSVEINRARQNVDKFLAIFNQDKIKSRNPSRQQSRISSRCKEMKKNAVISQAQNEIQSFEYCQGLQNPKFKKLSTGSFVEKNKVQIFPKRKRFISLHKPK